MIKANAPSEIKAFSSLAAGIFKHNAKSREARRVLSFLYSDGEDLFAGSGRMLVFAPTDLPRGLYRPLMDRGKLCPVPAEGDDAILIPVNFRSVVPDPDRALFRMEFDAGGAEASVLALQLYLLATGQRYCLADDVVAEIVKSGLAYRAAICPGGVTLLSSGAVPIVMVPMRIISTLPKQRLDCAVRALAGKVSALYPEPEAANGPVR